MSVWAIKLNDTTSVSQVQYLSPHAFTMMTMMYWCIFVQRRRERFVQLFLLLCPPSNHYCYYYTAVVPMAQMLGLCCNDTDCTIRPIAHWWRFKIGRQVLTLGKSTARVTDTCYQDLYLHTSIHVHSSSACTVPYMAKPWHARTNLQNGFIQRVLWLRWWFCGVLLMMLMQLCRGVKKRPTKEEEWFGVESALN